jgi:hypothetical protein
MHARLTGGSILAAVVSAALIASGCGSTTAALDPAAEAAQTTSHAGGAHMSMTMSLHIPGASAPVRMSATGSFNFTAKEGNLTARMTGIPKLPGGTMSMTELYKANAVYVDSPLTAGKLPHGAHWLKLNLAGDAQSLGLGAQSLTGGQSDPSQYLQYLEAAGGKVKAVGHEDVRGTPTTHYEGTIDLAKSLERLHTSKSAKLRDFLSKARTELGSTQIPIDVWIDAHHLVRRMDMNFSPGQGAQRIAVDLRIELFDFGATPTVTAPSDSDVFEPTPSL